MSVFQSVMDGFFGSFSNIASCLFILGIAVGSHYYYSKPLKSMYQSINRMIFAFKSDNTLEQVMDTSGTVFISLDKPLQDAVAKLNSDKLQDKIDIDKYFNLVSLVEIPSKRKSAELIPGVLTALGILGTFIGLVFGLSGLNASSNESLTASVSTVINGMTLAFWTSIFGIISSIIWNRTDKLYLGKVRTSLYELRRILFEETGAKSTEDLLSEIKSYHMEQALALNNMGSDFAQILKDVLLPSIESGFSNAITETLSPIATQVSKAVESISESVSKSQTEGLNNIVDNFVQGMNSSLQGQFENLSSTIDDLCKWQRQTMEDMNALIIEMRKSATDQRLINEHTKDIIENLNLYSDKIMLGNESLTNQLLAFEEVSKNVTSSTEINKLVFDETVNTYNSLMIKQEKFMIHSDLINDSFKEIWKSSSEQMELASEILKESTTEFSAGMQEGIKGTFESFDKNLNLIMRHVNSNIDNLKESTTDMTKMYTDSSAILKRTIGELNETIKTIPKQITVNYDNNN